MSVTVLFDVRDEGVCNLRCLSPGRETYCARYGHCLAACAHRIHSFVDRRLQESALVAEEHSRSEQGGRSRSRVRRDETTDSVVEEIELYCTTLEFGSLLAADGATPAS